MLAHFLIDVRFSA